MEFSCDRKTLANSIGIVQKAVSYKTTMPILKGIYLELKDDRLKLIATDLELGIEHEIEVDTRKEGNTVVDARLFSEIIRKLPDAEIDLTLKSDNQLNIKCQNSEFNIICHDPNEFPALPVVEEDYIYKIPQDLLKNMINQVIFATSQDVTRPVLTGALLEIENDILNMVALDGYRLALSRGKVESVLDNKVIIPAKTLSEISRLINEDDENMDIILTKRHALFKINNTKLITRLLEGEFINYKQIIPSEYKTKIRVRTRDLLNSIERASLVAREGKNNLVKLKILDGKIYISSNSELGEVKEEVFIELMGNELEIAFNSKYIVDALKVIEDEEIYIEFTSNLSPGIIKSTTSDNYTHLILPVRLS